MAKQLTNKSTNRKQKKFIKKVIETGHNIAKAADLAGYESEYGYHLMRQPKIQTGIQKALEDADLTDDSAAVKIKEGQKINGDQAAAMAIISHDEVVFSENDLNIFPKKSVPN